MKPLSIIFGAIFAMSLGVGAHRLYATPIGITTAPLGALIGWCDAVLNGRDMVKGAWDGGMTGLVAPTALVGLGVGVGVGVIVDVVSFHPIDMPSMVGWGSLGAGIGTLWGHVDAVSALAPGPVQTVGLVWDVGYLSTAGFTAIGEAKSLQRSVSDDAVLHRGTCAAVRRGWDPGTAMTIGVAKEASDYFLSTGHTEFRDLQNDWEGVFGGVNRY